MFERWSFIHKQMRHMVSKAFLKSVYVQNNFLREERYKETKACKINMLPAVEWPFLNPA